MTPAQLGALSKGLKGGGKLTGGYVVPLPTNQQSGAYRQIAAPTIEGGDGDRADVLLAMDEDADPVITVGAESKLYFTWGEAEAQGSPVRIYADSLLLSEAAAEVSLC